MTETRLSTEDLVRPAPRDDELRADTPDTDTPEARTPATDTTASAAPDQDTPLVDEDQAADFLDRWSDVQARFVDDPQGAVRDGDSLVAELMQSLAHRFAQCKSDLEDQWQRGTEPQTEELRLALQQDRSFFQRLLST